LDTFIDDFKTLVISVEPFILKKNVGKILSIQISIFCSFCKHSLRWRCVQSLVSW